MEITPSVGFARVGLLEDRAKRRKYGLPAELRPPKLEDDSARQFNEFVARQRLGRRPTSPSPPTATRRRSRRARRSATPACARIRTRAARCTSRATRRSTSSSRSSRAATTSARGVARAGAGRPAGARRRPGRVLRAGPRVQRRPHARPRCSESLALFSKEFTPYQFKQARIIEFPAYAAFAQSFANTIPFSEGIGFVQHWTRPDQDRRRHLRHRARDRPPVVGPPAGAGRPAGRARCWWRPSRSTRRCW